MVDGEGAPRHLIEIELTESAFFDDKNALVHTINRLKEYGFTVSMDDFGSGYSSLNSLKDMPLDVLKLDAEFFRGENADDRGKKVVSETIRLARRLGMRTVAEGVEAREYVDFLADEECDMIQGFYFEKPMPGSDYEVKMKERISDKPAAHSDAAADTVIQNAVAESTVQEDAATQNAEAEGAVQDGAAVQNAEAEGAEQESTVQDGAAVQNAETESAEQESTVPENDTEGKADI